MKKYFLFLLFSIVASTGYCQEFNADDLKKALEEGFIPEKYFLYLCTDTPLPEKEIKEEESDGKEPKGETEQAPEEKVDEYCIKVVNECQGRMECIRQIDEFLEKKIGKRGGSLGDSVLFNFVKMLKGAKIAIGISRGQKVKIVVVDAGNNIVYSRPVAKVGVKIFSSPVLKRGKFNAKAINTYQSKQTLLNKRNAVASVMDRFAITISPQ